VTLARGRGMQRPWAIAAMIAVAIAISYLDRQTLPWAIKYIEADIPIGNQTKAALDSAFLATYGLMYLGGGWLLDKVGTRRGLPRFLHGPAAAVGIAFINAFGNLGGYLGPLAVGAIRDSTGSTSLGMLFLAGSFVLTIVMILIDRAGEDRSGAHSPSRA
jgi:sugar phosphate permease